MECSPEVQNTSENWPPLELCRICFAKGIKLYYLDQNCDLLEGYELLTGQTIGADDCLPPYLCPSCAMRLVVCARFLIRSLRAHRVLLKAVRRHRRIR